MQKTVNGISTQADIEQKKITSNIILFKTIEKYGNELLSLQKLKEKVKEQSLLMMDISPDFFFNLGHAMTIDYMINVYAHDGLVGMVKSKKGEEQYKLTGEGKKYLAGLENKVSYYPEYKKLFEEK